MRGGSVVVAHLVAGQHLHVEAAMSLLDDGQQHRAILIVHKFALAPVATGCDVVLGSREFDTQRALHRLLVFIVGRALNRRPDPILLD